MEHNTADLADFRLVQLRLDMRQDYLDFVEEMYVERPNRYAWVLESVKGNYSGYLKRLQEVQAGINLLPGRVPESMFCLQHRCGQLYGTLRVRHRIDTPYLSQVAGHIGYDIRPSQRRKGYGVLQLALGLEEARKIGLKRVMISCNETNLASARVIEKNGGVFQNLVEDSESPGVMVRCYWIDL